MDTYGDLVELARICLKQARKAENASVSAELRNMAKGYQVRAATLDHGRLPDIGEGPHQSTSTAGHIWSQSADRVSAPAPNITLQGL
jgi:hypothetical protein